MVGATGGSWGFWCFVPNNFSWARLTSVHRMCIVFRMRKFFHKVCKILLQFCHQDTSYTKNQRKLKGLEENIRVGLRRRVYKEEIEELGGRKSITIQFGPISFPSTLVTNSLSSPAAQSC